MISKPSITVNKSILAPSHGLNVSKPSRTTSPTGVKIGGQRNVHGMSTERP